MKPAHYTHSTPRQEGTAVIVVLAILALLLMFSTANLITLNVLDAELELIEARQQQRIEQAVAPIPTVDSSEANTPNRETRGESD